MSETVNTTKREYTNMDDTSIPSMFSASFAKYDMSALPRHAAPLWSILLVSSATFLKSARTGKSASIKFKDDSTSSTMLGMILRYEADEDDENKDNVETNSDSLQGEYTLELTVNEDDINECEQTFEDTDDLFKTVIKITAKDMAMMKFDSGYALLATFRILVRCTIDWLNKNEGGIEHSRFKAFSEVEGDKRFISFELKESITQITKSDGTEDEPVFKLDIVK